MITMTPETLEAYIQKARDEGFEKAWKQAGHLDLDLRQRDVQIVELKAENARYREALEWYAWKCEPKKIQRSDGSGTLVLVEDKEKALACYNEDLFLFGKRAREALKGGE